MPPKLIIEVLGDTSNLEKSLKRSTRETQQFGHSVERAGRGALSASVGFKGLGRSVAFASSAFLGGAGFVFAIKSTIAAAEESQRVLGQTQNAVTRSGESWKKYGKQIKDTALAQAQLSGFDDERLLGTFSLLVRRTKDVNEALRLNATAANVARGANIDLETAAKIVQRASVGQARGLAALGISYSKASTGAELLRQINQKFARSAETFGNTAAGAQDRFRVALENFQEVLGREALPAIANYLNKGADWLNQDKNQQRVLGTLRSAVGLVKDAVELLTPVVKDSAAAAEAFSSAVGGAKNALKLLIVTAGAWKAASLITSFRNVGIAAGEAGAAGKIAGLRAQLGLLARTAPITIPIILGVEVVLNKDRIDSAVTGFLKSHGLGFLAGEHQVTDFNKLPGFAKKQLAGNLSRSQLAAQGQVPPKSRFFFTNNPPTSIQSPATFGSASAGRTPTGIGTLSRAQRNQLALAQAGLTAGTADDLAALADQRSILAGKIAAVRRRLGGASGKKARDLATQLQGFINDDASALGQITSINQAAAADAKSAADAAAAAAKKRTDAIRAAAKKVQDALKKMAAAEQKARLDTVQVALATNARGRPLGVKGGPLTLAGINAEAAKKNERDQFLALGLTATGQERAPSVVALRLAATKLQGAVSGTFLDTKKTQSVLAGIRKVLSGHLHAISDDMRRTVKGILDDLDNQLKNSDVLQSRFTHISPNKLAKQLGFGGGREGIRAAAAILGQIGVGGSVPSGGAAFAGAGGGVHFHAPVYFQGVDDLGKMEAALAKRARARPQVRRGAR